MSDEKPKPNANGVLRVRHIGTSWRRSDTWTGSNTEWFGYGDIKTVPAKDWEVLKRYPDLWELAAEDVPPEAPSQAETAKAAAVFEAARAAEPTPAPTAAPAPARKTLGLKR